MLKRTGLVHNVDDIVRYGSSLRCWCGNSCFVKFRNTTQQKRKDKIMVGHHVKNIVGDVSLLLLGGGYKKKKILKLAKEYASKRELGWETFYREMSGLLK